MDGKQPETAPEAVARRVAQDGWAILPDVADTSLLLALRESVERLLVDVPFGDNVFLGERTRRIFNLLARDRLFERIPLLLLPVAEQILDAELLLSSLTAIEMNPGESDQPFHADDGSLPLARPHEALTCTAILALTDFDLANGATRLVPGSHRRDRRPRPGERPDFVQAVMPAGSALLYHGSLWHAGAANRSDARRMGIVCNYCAGFLRQEECQLLALPRERVAEMPPRLRRLVGYGRYKGLLGHVDQRDGAGCDEAPRGYAPGMPRTVEFFFSPGSRYSYLAASRMGGIEARHGCEVIWRPVQGSAIRAHRGRDPFDGRPVSGQYEWSYRERDAKAWADYYGIGYREPPEPHFDFDLLARAAAAACRLGSGAAYGRAICETVYASDTWPLDLRACLAVAEAVGVDPAKLRDVLEAPATRDLLAANALEAHERGAFGVPTCFLGDAMYWGNDRLVLLEHALGGAREALT
jgi:2-hydroxychromene-2-carboxylate isomerase